MIGHSHLSCFDAIEPHWVAVLSVSEADGFLVPVACDLECLVVAHSGDSLAGCLAAFVTALEALNPVVAIAHSAAAEVAVAVVVVAVAGDAAAEAAVDGVVDAIAVVEIVAGLGAAVAGFVDDAAAVAAVAAAAFGSSDSESVHPHMHRDTFGISASSHQQH